MSILRSSLSLTLRHIFELFEPDRQPVSIGPILTPPRQFDHLPGDPLEAEFEKRAIMDFEQSIGNVIR